MSNKYDKILGKYREDDYELVTYTLTPTTDSVQHVPASASADSDDGVNVAANVLDSSTATWWQSADTIMPHWVKLDLGDGNAQVVNQFRLTNIGSGYSPSDFTIEGSNNDADWTVLKTITGAVVDPDGTGTNAEAYNFVNAVAYRYYKINVTNNVDSSPNIVVIADISLWFSYLGADWGNPYIMGTNNEDVLYVDTTNIVNYAFVFVNSTTPKKIVNVGCISGGNSNIIAFAWDNDQGAQTNGNRLPSFNMQQGIFINGGKNTDIVPNNPSGWDFVNKFCHTTPGPISLEGGFDGYLSGRMEEGKREKYTLNANQYNALTDGNNDGINPATKLAIPISPYDANNVYWMGKFGIGTDNPTEKVDVAGNIQLNGNKIYGDIASGGNLTLQSTANATKGKILFGTSAYDEVNNMLGIGTTSPGKQLSIIGSGSNRGLAVGDATDTAAVNFATDGGGRGLMVLRNQGVTKISLNADGSGSYINIGNVGIGTTSPTSKLHGVTTLSAATGDEVAYQLDYTTNKLTSGNDTGLLINMTDTASPGTSYPLDIKVGGVSKFRVNNYGSVFTPILNSNSSSATLSIGASANKSAAGLVGLTIEPVTWSQTSGNNAIVKIAPTYNQTSGTAANTDLLINRTETAVGSGTQLLIDAQVATSSKWKLDNLGNTTQVGRIISSLATGTSPLSVSSTTVNTNLNADMVDDKHVGTSGNTIPLLDGANTWSGAQTIAADISFSGSGNGLPYGSMYGDDINQTVTISASSTYYELGAGLSGGSCNNFTFQNNKELKCLVAGTYKVDWGMSIACAAANQHVEGAVMINSTAQANTVGESHLTTANDDKHVGGTGIITLAVDDVVKFCVENETGTNNLIVDHANLSLVMVGG